MFSSQETEKKVGVRMESILVKLTQSIHFITRYLSRRSLSSVSPVRLHDDNRSPYNDMSGTVSVPY